MRDKNLTNNQERKARISEYPLPVKEYLLLGADSPKDMGGK